jgi:hypothetical protein
VPDALRIGLTRIVQDAQQAALPAVLELDETAALALGDSPIQGFGITGAHRVRLLGR